MAFHILGGDNVYEITCMNIFQIPYNEDANAAKGMSAVSLSRSA